MLEHTKKHHTDNVTLCVIGPAAKRNDALKALENLGFAVQDDDSIPWQEALGVKEEDLPGICLSGARYRECMTQEQLAKATGIPRRHISEMENNKRPIGKQNARKLADVLNVDPRRFLSV